VACGGKAVPARLALSNSVLKGGAAKAAALKPNMAPAPVK